MATGSKLYVVRVGFRKFIKLYDNNIVEWVSRKSQATVLGSISALALQYSCKKSGYRVAELVAVNRG